MRVAVYAGTFDPPTLGHLSVIERSGKLFDRLWVVVAKNPHKQPLFSADERVSLLREIVRGHDHIGVEQTDGYVVELAQRLGAQYLVRGVRGATDIEAEISLSHLNQQLAPEIETVFVPAHAAMSEVSSSRLKQLAQEGQDISRFCPPAVLASLLARVAGLAITLERGPHV